MNACRLILYRMAAKPQVNAVEVFSETRNDDSCRAGRKKLTLELGLDNVATIKDFVSL